MSLSNSSRSVIKKVLAVETSEVRSPSNSVSALLPLTAGAGARVRRSIGSMNLRNLTPFLMLDHFHVAQGAGFPDHPHRGQATVTYMLEGSSRHEDSAGHAGTIETGGVQWMCAVRFPYLPLRLTFHSHSPGTCVDVQGKGIIHAEMPVHAPGVPEPRGLQLWVDLPKQFKMVEPSYQELGPEGIPTAYPTGPDGQVTVKVISGKSHGVESPVRPLGGCWFFHVTMKKSGASMFQEIRESTPYVFSDIHGALSLELTNKRFPVWKGAVSIGNNGPVHDSFHTLVLSNEKGETGIQLTAAQDDTQFAVIAGAPLDQTVFQYGPFVMTTRDEIQQTLLDYQFGRNGFEKAHTWKSKIGN
ncbi:RmlC-like cupin domain-containing protein [Scleroderma yunnanense]